MFVTRRGGRDVLLVHRSPEQGGYWHVVAGGVEPGETAVEAAERELREETGLAARADRRDRGDGVRLDADQGARRPRRTIGACSRGDVLSRRGTGRLGADTRLGARRPPLVRLRRSGEHAALAGDGTGASGAPGRTLRRPATASAARAGPPPRARPSRSRTGANTSITTAPAGPAVASCGTFEGIVHVSPGPSSRVSSPIRNVIVAADHHPELLVLVAMLLHDRVGIELDDAERQALAVDEARVDPVPDPSEREFAQIVEGAHRGVDSGSNRRSKSTQSWTRAKRCLTASRSSPT